MRDGFKAIYTRALNNYSCESMSIKVENAGLISTKILKEQSNNGTLVLYQQILMVKIC